MHLNSCHKFSILLASCTNHTHLKPLKSQLIINGFFKKDAFLGPFLTKCFDLNKPQLALTTFSSINPTLFLQNLTIRCLHDHKLYQDVVTVYKFCRFSKNCPSDHFTFPVLIKACSALNAGRNGQEIHCVVVRTGFDCNVVVQTALIDFYAKNGEIGIARKVHDEMLHPDLVSWNALLSGYSLYGFNQEVFEVFKRIRLTELKPNVSTFASLIPVCSRLGDLRIGKSIHGLVLKCGYFVNDFLIPAFISMYGSNNELSVARDIFDYVSEKNVAMWNSMISVYTQSKKFYDAIELFGKMTRDHIKPDMVTFVSIIPSSEIIDSTNYGESLHAYVIKLGLQNQPAVATVILSMYAKYGHLNSVKFLFDHMSHRNLLSWNALVSGYVYNKCWTMSLASFREMQATGVNPDAVSLINIVSTCSGLKATLLGKSAHGFSLKRDIDSDLNLCNALLAFYTNVHKMRYALRLFKRMAFRDDVSWNTLISGYVHNGEDENAVLLLHLMQKKGVKFDPVTLISVLPCFKNLEDLVRGMAVHGCAMKLSLDSDVSLANALISMYMNCGDFDSGKLVFDDMPIKDVVSWNALIAGYHLHRLEKEGLLLIPRMIKDGYSPNPVTLLNVLPMCYMCTQVKSIHAYAVRRWSIVDESLFITSLISSYGRFGDMRSCNFVFQMGDKRDISLWNAILAARVESTHATMAVSLFIGLLRVNVQPDYITILSLTSACAQLNNINLTNCIFSYCIRKGIDKYVAVSNALIDLHSKSGNISYAEKLFNEMHIKDNISWSTMINGYGLHGNGESAFALFTRMRQSGFKPDETTYVSILSACSHAGLVDEGWMVFKSMIQDDAISPRMEHYACMVDLLGRTGHLKEAYDVVKSLPFEPSVSMLESLLGSCVNHGGTEVGERIGKMILERDAVNSGAYVMLYNVYAAAGRWSEADKIRCCMEAKNLSKLPGFSLIEGQKPF